MSDPISILPPNRTTAEAAMEQAVFLGDPDQSGVSALMDPQTCPAELLGLLAWALSVDDWDPDWSDGTKRAACASAVSVHRRKGTVRSVKEALAAAGYGEAQIIERFGWEQHDGTYLRDGSITRVSPDHWAEYRVVLTRPISIEQAAQVREILSNTAPVSRRLKVLEFTQALNLHNNTILRDGSFTRGVA